MNSVIVFLRHIAPFLITLFLWRLNASFWNPGGILALIPIFYYTFVRPVNFFPFFGLLICFLIDYRCNLSLFWTSMFCLFYAINGFQNYVEIKYIDKNALCIFMLFVGCGIFLLMFSALTWMNFINNIWMFIWLSVLYIPITSLNRWIQK